MNGSTTSFENDPRRRREIAAQPLWDEIYQRELGAVDVQRPTGSILDREHGIDALIGLSSGQQLSVQEKALSAEHLHYATVTIEDLSQTSDGSPVMGDWDRCLAKILAIGYLSADGRSITDYVIINAANLKIATARGEVRWDVRLPRPHSACRSSFRYTKVASLPESCVIVRQGFGI